jgi:hypothetical protein
LLAYAGTNKPYSIELLAMLCLHAVLLAVFDRYWESVEHLSLPSARRSRG